MRLQPSFTLFLCLCFVCQSCIETPNQYSKLPPGPWRAVLKLTDPDVIKSQENTISEGKVIDYFELPFNLDVNYDGDSLNVFIINGKEKIRVENVKYGRDKSTAKDTLRLEMSAYDTQIDAFYEDNFIEGYWMVNYKEKYKIPFLATFGEKHRFIKNKPKESANFAGKWKVMFEYDNDDAYPAIAEFQQNEEVLTGTFRTETGDYRYLSGNAYGNKLRLSVFDGAHAFLFSGSLDRDTIYGEFRSGKHYKSKWYATRDEAFSLKDPYNMTKSVDAQKATWSFEDSNNKVYSSEQGQFKNKVSLINIMGTWCPNCKDEIKYLKEVKQKFPEIEIVSIAFERYKDENKAKAMIEKYKETLNIPWPVLYGGYANKKTTGETFSFLDKIYSYPTLVVANKNDEIVDIHTGFNGPATSEYETFKKAFETKLSQLIASQ